MEQKKKNSDRFQVIATELKKDIITSVGSMFVEIKGDMRAMEFRLDGKINKLDEKVDNLNEKVTWHGSVIDEIKKDVKSTLEAQGKILAHETVVKNHEKRLTRLEGL